MPTITPVTVLRGNRWNFFFPLIFDISKKKYFRHTPTLNNFIVYANKYRFNLIIYLDKGQGAPNKRPNWTSKFIGHINYTIFTMTCVTSIISHNLFIYTLNIVVLLIIYYNNQYKLTLIYLY